MSTRPATSAALGLYDDPELHADDCSALRWRDEEPSLIGKDCNCVLAELVRVEDQARAFLATPAPEGADAWQQGYEAAWQRLHEPDALAKREAAPERQALDRPRVVCICGSTRFAASMNIEAEMLTLVGKIVVRPEVIAYSRERGQQFVEPEVKAALDVLHLRKIDLADEVVVVTEDGYIGESTRHEIAYAEQTGKPIRYAEYARLAAAQEEG